MLKTIINYVIFSVIFLIPIMVFMFYGLKNNLHKSLIITISCLYIFLSVIFSKISYDIFPFLIVLWNISLISKSEKNVFRFKKFNIFKALKYGICSYIISFSVSFIYIIGLINLNFKINDQKIINEMLELPMNKFFLMIPIIIILAPVVEEFVFRWVLYDKFLKKYFGKYGSAILSSLIFALVHFNLKSFAVIMTLGIVNCWIITNKGYWYAVFNHLFFNCTSIIVLLLNKLG